MRRLLFAGLFLGLAIKSFPLAGLNFFTLSCRGALPFPEQKDRACYVYGRIGSRDDPYKQGECEIMDDGTSEDEQDHENDQGRGPCEDRSAQGLVDARVDDFQEGLATQSAQVFSNPVEDHNVVI